NLHLVDRVVRRVERGDHDAAGQHVLGQRLAWRHPVADAHLVAALGERIGTGAALHERIADLARRRPGGDYAVDRVTRFAVDILIADIGLRADPVIVGNLVGIGPEAAFLPGQLHPVVEHQRGVIGVALAGVARVGYVVLAVDDYGDVRHARLDHGIGRLELRVNLGDAEALVSRGPLAAALRNEGRVGDVGISAADEP